MSRILVLIIAASAASAAWAGDAWHPDPESYRYAVSQQVNGKWKQTLLTNDSDDAHCVYTELWNDPVTAVRVTDKKTGKVIRLIDCKKAQSHSS